MINKILKKRGSPYEIKFCSSFEDPWFIEISRYKIKTKEIKETHTIIEKDVINWVSYMNSFGFYENITKN